MATASLRRLFQRYMPKAPVVPTTLRGGFVRGADGADCTDDSPLPEDYRRFQTGRTGVPKAPVVPTTAALRQLRNARMRLLTNASPRSRSRNSSRYHSREKPPHTEVYSFNASKISSVWGGFSLEWYRELFRDRDLGEALVGICPCPPAGCSP